MSGTLNILFERFAVTLFSFFLGKTLQEDLFLNQIRLFAIGMNMGLGLKPLTIFNHFSCSVFSNINKTFFTIQ